MGNLLSYNTSFSWADNTIDRNSQISNMHEAVFSARDYGDNLYIHPDLFANGSESQALFLLVWTNYENFRNSFPWIKEPEYQILYNIFNFFRLAPNNSLNLQALLQNTRVTNNAWIGVERNCYEYLVCDNPSWNDFHRLFVSRFTLQQKRENFDYFIRFYIAELTIQQNQIQQLINQGRVHNSITRIDLPHIDIDKIHIHFNNNENCALNIDGTWKHEVQGFTIPEIACSQLNDWGFILPHEYYLL